MLRQHVQLLILSTVLKHPIVSAIFDDQCPLLMFFGTMEACEVVNQVLVMESSVGIRLVDLTRCYGPYGQLFRVNDVGRYRRCGYVV